MMVTYTIKEVEKTAAFAFLKIGKSYVLGDFD
jgi:hypothetical protein